MLQAGIVRLSEAMRLYQSGDTPEALKHLSADGPRSGSRTSSRRRTDERILALAAESVFRYDLGQDAAADHALDQAQQALPEILPSPREPGRQTLIRAELARRPDGSYERLGPGREFVDFALARRNEQLQDFAKAAVLYEKVGRTGSAEGVGFPFPLWATTRAFACDVKSGLRSEERRTALERVLCERPAQLWEASAARRWQAISFILEDEYDAANEFLFLGAQLEEGSPRQHVLNALSLVHLYYATGENDLARELLIQAAAEALEMRMHHALGEALAVFGRYRR